MKRALASDTRRRPFHAASQAKKETATNENWENPTGGEFPGALGEYSARVNRRPSGDGDRVVVGMERELDGAVNTSTSSLHGAA